MVKTKGLGRGLDALLSGDNDSAASDVLQTVEIGKLQPGKYQPRTQMDQESLASLAASIKAQGVMQPILVRAVGSDRYEIIAGERRWRASQLAGLREVPVLLREIPDEAALAMALIENIQRENLNPLEEANGIKRLIDEFSMTHQVAADAVGRSRTAVTNLLRLLNLAKPVQEMMMQGRIDMGHARALLTLEGANQITAAQHIAQNGLSVREAEALVQRATNGEKRKSAKKTTSADVRHLEEELSDLLGADVQIQAGVNGGGKVSVRYHSLDQLDGLVEAIRGKRNSSLT
ncbi:MAG TPA: ParB/RepB/Spo0J family partition protein [Methylophilaceae bacterium]|nr:ParB/RepB/Spo0J family partition protein [Methylophilaceae bacterium]